MWPRKTQCQPRWWPVTDTPDYAQIAYDLGLRRAAYPILEAFAHLGVGKTYGWELVKTGVCDLGVVRFVAVIHPHGVLGC